MMCTVTSVDSSAWPCDVDPYAAFAAAAPTTRYHRDTPEIWATLPSSANTGGSLPPAQNSFSTYVTGGHSPVPTQSTSRLYSTFYQTAHGGQATGPSSGETHGGTHDAEAFTQATESSSVPEEPRRSGRERQDVQDAFDHVGMSASEDDEPGEFTRLMSDDMYYYDSDAPPDDALLESGFI
jgi:hypothetical protein